MDAVAGEEEERSGGSVVSKRDAVRGTKKEAMKNSPTV
jgi:hypothetical protein